MTRAIIGIISGVGGIILGTAGGRSTSNVTMKDVKAVPGKTFSTISGFVKRTGTTIGTGVKSMAFWNRKTKKDTPVKETKVDLEVKYQGLNEKYSTLSDDFTEAVKAKNIAETDLTDTQEKLRQEKEKVGTYETTFEEQDAEVTKLTSEKNQAEDDLKKANAEIKKLKKSAPKAE